MLTLIALPRSNRLLIRTPTIFNSCQQLESFSLIYSAIHFSLLTPSYFFPILSPPTSLLVAAFSYWAAMKYKGVIFDLDGTLLDTLEDLSDSVNRVLAARGFPTHTVDEYRYLIGDGTAMLITRALPEEERSEETIRFCLDAYYEDYGQNWNVKTRPYDGIPEMLDALTERGLKVAVLSNKQHELTKRCVAHFLPNWTFKVVLGQRDEATRKPDPAGALEVAERLNIPPGGFLYVGDSAIDMKTAIAAGMFAVGVRWGFRPVEELQEGGAQALIERPLDILNLL